MPAARQEGRAVTKAPQRVILRAPLYRTIAANKRGFLPPPGGKEDFVVSKQGVQVRCGLRKLRAVPIGDRRLRVHHPANCRKKLKIQAKPGNARALMLRSNPQRHVIARVHKNRARFVVRGKEPKTLRVKFINRGKYRTLSLSKRGWATLPKTSQPTTRFRIATRGAGKKAPIETASMTISR